MKTKISIVLVTLIAVSGIISCKTGIKQTSDIKPYSGKKILFINSYHKGYEWSDGIVRGARAEADSADIELKIFEMDAKRKPSPEEIRESALKAKKIIEEYNPDVVITSDDVAAKYLIVPYYKNARLPFVFCGVNWDASEYGFPFNNVTGLVEIEYMNGIIGYMKDHARGSRIGFISSDQESERKSAANYKKQLKLKLNEEVYVKTAAEWKKEFLRLQDKVDMLIISNTIELKDWDENSMAEWTVQNTKIPSGTVNKWVMKFSLLGLIKIPEEQGEWAVKAAEKIMSGISPKSIPIEKSKRSKLYINTTIAKKLNVKINESLMLNAVIVK